MQAYDIISIIVLPIYIVSTYWLATSLLGERIYSKKTEIMSYVLFGIIINIIYYITKIPILILAFNLIGIFIISLNYSSNLLSKISCTLSIYFFALISEVIVWRGIGFVEIDFSESNDKLSIMGFFLARIFVFIVAYFIYKYKKAKVRNSPVPWYYYLAHILILFGTLYLYIVSLVSNLSSTSQVVISSIVVLIVNIMIILVDDKIYKTMIVNSERNLLKQQNIAYENQTEIINQSLTAIKSLKHDMKNHIITLDSMYDNNRNEDAKEYTVKILEQIDNNNQLVQSNNFIIDSIVNFKLQELNNRNIGINIDVKVPPQLNILAYDLTIILGNLLDNAITALKEISPTKDKKLVFSMYCKKGSLIILIDNSFNGKLNMQNGKYKTTKTFKSNHGIGLQSAEETIATYGGNMQIEHTDNTFSVAVLIPYTE